MRNIIIIVFAFFFLSACEGSGDYSPKPKGYFRIVYPKREYHKFIENTPFTFDYPAYAEAQKDLSRNALPNWYNLSFPQFNARLHLTYYDIASIKEYEMMVEDARKLAFKHTVKATAIDQKRINYPDNKVYGIYYEIQGNTASSVQFFLTDSVKHYFRGALYFNERPQYDSIAPVIEFLKKDINHLISTFKWNEVSSKQLAVGSRKATQRTTHNTQHITYNTQRTAAYYGAGVPMEADSLDVLASKVLSLFLSGNVEEAYDYFSPEFAGKVPLAQMEGIQKQWASAFGKFERIAGAKIVQQGLNEGVVLNTIFENAKPVFTLIFDPAGKVVGFFKTADNLNGGYKDPVYAAKGQYEEKEITVKSGDFALPGTLTIPKGKTGFPVVVFVHGSGPNDRDESLLNIKTFRDLALGLAAHGIATIRYDKRTRIYGLKSAPPGQKLTVKEEVTDDAHAALELAGKIPGADLQKIFLLGHSLGAMMAPKIANEEKGLAGVITLGNPARKFADLLNDQFSYLFSLYPQNEQTKAALDDMLKQAEILRNASKTTDPDKVILGASNYYWADINAYDQVAAARKLTIPLLIIQGGRDYNVSMKDFNTWKEKLKGMKNVSFISYPKLNHGFTEGEGAMSTPQEYETAANVPGYVIDDIAAFILKK